jgi:hypothetical protein
MRGRVVVPATAGENANSTAHGVVWLLLTLFLFVIVFLPILIR